MAASLVARVPSSSSSSSSTGPKSMATAVVSSTRPRLTALRTTWRAASRAASYSPLSRIVAASSAERRSQTPSVHASSAPPLGGTGHFDHTGSGMT